MIILSERCSLIDARPEYMEENPEYYFPKPSVVSYRFKQELWPALVKSD